MAKSPGERFQSAIELAEAIDAVTAASGSADGDASGPVIRLHASDNVLIARRDIGIGSKLDGGLTSKSQVPAGHKIAAR